MDLKNCSKKHCATFLGLGLILTGFYIKTTKYNVSSTDFMIASGIATIIINFAYLLYLKYR